MQTKSKLLEELKKAKTAEEAKKILSKASQAELMAIFNMITPEGTHQEITKKIKEKKMKKIYQGRENRVFVSNKKTETKKEEKSSLKKKKSKTT